jgi:hypothetical protein
MARLTLEGFSEQLGRAFAADLTAVVLYGSAASASGAERSADQNLLVVVRAITPAALRAAAAATDAWRSAGNPAPLILTEAEWRSSRDVFAMEHLDIAARHRVLAGKLPELPSPSPDDLRRQLEYEAMGALIHLRQGILASNGDTKRELALMVASKGTVLTLLRSLLRLHTHAVPDDAVEVVRAAAGLASFDAGPFLEVVAHANGTTPIPKDRADAVLTAYNAGLKRLVAHVDALVHPDAPAVD